MWRKVALRHLNLLFFSSESADSDYQPIKLFALESVGVAVWFSCLVLTPLCLFIPALGLS